MDVVVLGGRQILLEPFIYSIRLDVGRWRADPVVDRICRGDVGLVVLAYPLEDGASMTDGLHALVTTPVIQGDYVYGICSYGQLRCLNAKTGERVWETLDATKEQARWASGFLVRNGDRFFINNDRGELIIAKLSPERYEEISRTKLLKPTSRSGNRRELGAVNWSHPAYANRHIFARNDEEIISVSLSK